MSETPRWLKEEAIERADGVCEAMIPLVCTWRGTDVHHRKKRSQGGPHTIENALFVCRQCHVYIEANPAISYERGLLIHGWEPVTWPPKYYRGVSYELDGTTPGVEEEQPERVDLWDEYSAD